MQGVHERANGCIACAGARCKRNCRPATAVRQLRDACGACDGFFNSDLAVGCSGTRCGKAR